MTTSSTARVQKLRAQREKEGITRREYSMGNPEEFFGDAICALWQYALKSDRDRWKKNWCDTHAALQGMELLGTRVGMKCNEANDGTEFLKKLALTLAFEVTK